MDIEALIPSATRRARARCVAIGDVRAGSTKRVAAAVGEGSMAIAFIHQYLSEREHGTADIETRPDDKRPAKDREVAGST